MTIVKKLLLGSLVACSLAITLSLVGCGSAKKTESSEAAEPDSLVRLPAAAIASGEIRLDTVREEALADTVALTGQIQADPLRIAHVAPRVSGAVQSVRAVVGDRVARGQVVASLYSPEFTAAQGDYLLAHERVDQARKSAGQDTPALAGIAESARRRLETLGAAAVDIARLDDGHQPLAYLPLRSPIAGVVTEVEAALGKQVTAGTDIFGVANLSKVWGVVEAYERDFGRLRVGLRARIIASAYPDEDFVGHIASLEGAVKEATRTLSVRIQIPNPSLALKPGMFITARVATGTSRQAIVLSEGAVQEMGGRQVVFVAATESTFVPRPVDVLALGGNRVEIRNGLRSGERVAVHGAFLIKSQASKGELGEE